MARKEMTPEEEAREEAEKNSAETQMDPLSDKAYEKQKSEFDPAERIVQRSSGYDKA